MVFVNSLLIRTDVTCVKIRNNVVLAGIGGHIHIFDKTSRIPKAVIKVFEGQKIYGIVPESTFKQFLIYGENQIKSFTLDLKNCTYFEEITSFACDDWILAAKWMNSANNIVTVFMHNVAVLWTKEMKLITKVVCEERCLLYSAHLVNDTWDNLIVLSGTVFSQVLIWWPRKMQQDLCPVLCRLEGHKGVIFSIHYNSTSGLICSTSDDRSAMLWSVNSKNLLAELIQPCMQISFKCSLYGHSARVFRCRVLDDYVLTGGEDSLVNIWDLEGKLIRRLEAHQGACIWSLDCDEKNSVIATGGGDCGITTFSLNQSLAKRELCLKNHEVPKRVGLLKNNDVVSISEKGILEYYCVNEDKLIEIATHDDLVSYVLLEVSLCRNLVALAGYRGTVHIYKHFTNSLKHFCSHQLEDRSRIFALHWLSCKLYLTCGPEGKISLWNLKDSSPYFVKSLQLPPSKERWTTAACVCDNKFFAVGDRKGNIYMYSLQFTDPIQIIKKAHNYLGITNLYFKNNELISLGRNSILRRYHFDHTNEQLSLLSSDKLPFVWLAAMCEADTTTLLLSFLGDEFVMWDYNKRCTLLQFHCGGGHRSWDFYKNNNDISFVYIKDKNIHLTQMQWDFLQPVDIVCGFHTSEINSVCCFNFSRLCKCLVISGGEDTTLRISNVSFENDLINFTNTGVLKSHLSSIRVVTSCKVSVGNEKCSERHLIFSAGGRAQIVLWKLEVNFSGSDINVICSEKYSYYEQLKAEDSETRIMDLCTILVDGYIVLIAACSDGILKVFLIISHDNKNNYEMFLIGHVNYKLKCILKLSHLEICGHNIILSMATDGKIAFWDFTTFLNNIACYNKNNIDKSLLDFKNFYSVQVHQSGINSFSCRKLNNNQCIFLSGGDDNAIVMNLYEFNNHSEVIQVRLLSTFSDVSSHCAQITGVFLSTNYFLTTSIDQKLNFFKWSRDNGKLQCNHVWRHNSAVADIQGMKCFEEEGVTIVVLYGKGTEICKIKMDCKSGIDKN